MRLNRNPLKYILSSIRIYSLPALTEVRNKTATKIYVNMVLCYPQSLRGSSNDPTDVGGR